MPPKTKPTDAALEELRAFGLAYPGAHTKSPWPGHLDLAVNDKTFAYLSVPGEPFSISCKLPGSCSAALMLPFAKPTGYGLGKSGWVSATFERAGATPPVELFKAWIDESYRAQAPKKLVAQLDGAAGGQAPAKAKAPKAKAPAKAKAPKAKAPAKAKAPKAKAKAPKAKAPAKAKAPKAKAKAPKAKA